MNNEITLTCKCWEEYILFSWKKGSEMVYPKDCGVKVICGCWEESDVHEIAQRILDSKKEEWK